MDAFVAENNWVLEQGFRLGPKTYSGGGFSARQRIMSDSTDWQRLVDLAHVFRGPVHRRIYVRDSSRGVAYITAADVNLADLPRDVLLSSILTPELPVLRVQPGWTLLSCAGTVGNATYVRGDFADCAVSQDMLRVVPRDETLSGYLFAFLSTNVGRSMVRMGTYGSVVDRIEPEHIVDLPVPTPPEALGSRVHGLIEGAATMRTMANRLLDEAAGYFDSEAGAMPSAHHHARAIGLIESQQMGHRLDSFHHVGWAAEPRITGEPLEGRADIWSVSSMRRVWAVCGVPFGSGMNMFTNRPAPERRLARWAADEVDAYVQYGDILIQAYGQLNGLVGRPAYVGSRSAGWAIGHLMHRVRCRRPEDTAGVFAFLRSRSARRTLLRYSSGNQIPHLVPQALRDLQVPDIPDGVATTASRAIGLREQADCDEEQAIQEVEQWLSS